LILIASVLLLISVKNYSLYWDGVSFAWQIENQPIQDCFHKHHLLYTPFCFLIHSTMSNLIPNLRSIDTLVAINIAFGVIYLCICYKLLRIIFPNSSSAAILGTFLIAMSFTFGAHFRNASQYLIPLTICTVILMRIISRILKRDDVIVDIFDWILLFIAVLFHQISILVLPSLVYAQITSSKKDQAILTVTRNISVFFIFIISAYIYILSYGSFAYT